LRQAFALFVLVYFYVNCLLVIGFNPLASAEKLRVKLDKTMVGSAAAGHSKYLRALAMGDGATVCSPGFT